MAIVSTRSQFAVILAVAGSLWLPAGTKAQDSPVKAQIAVAEPTDQLPALDEVPPGQAVVTYRDGELTIKANNAPLINVLRAVCSQIGAELDSSQIVANEPVFVVLGPGRPRQVLITLLGNSPFNYVMSQSSDDPDALASIVVFPKPQGSAQPATPVAGDSSAQSQVTPAQANSTKTGDKPSVASKNASLQQMKELLAAAKAEGAVLDAQDGENGTVDATAALQQVEAQLNAIGDSAATGAGSSDPAQQPAAPGNPPPGRPQHRKRH